MNTVTLTWGECEKLAKDVATLVHQLQPHDTIHLFGVPRGGIPVAILVKNILEKLQRQVRLVTITEHYGCTNKTVVIDDTIDSGATQKRFSDNPFFALIDKGCSGHKYSNQWIIFPWEKKQ